MKTLNETSPAWPYLRAIGKALTVPGTNWGMEMFVDLQDQLSADEAQKELNEVLATILEKLDEVAAKLEVPAADLTDAALQLAEAAYLQRVARRFIYSDFKGIEQLEKLVPLKLDDVFVNLKVRPERAEAEPESQGAELSRMAQDYLARNPETERKLAEFDAERLLKLKKGGTAHGIDRSLAKSGGVVLLGGPGSGKTTLVKRLARSCALGAEVVRKRFPELPWCLPIVVPVATYDRESEGDSVLSYLRGLVEHDGGPALAEAFERRWGGGECLLLLDGLDEIASAGQRIGCARSVGALLGELGQNRVLVTSRPVGYSICRLSVPAEHVLLEPFERADIETFVRRWHVAYDAAVHPEKRERQAAEAEAEELIGDIQRHPRVEALATNPLMLTIIALIKQRNVSLPERRVELYEIALNTLIRSWNKARSLGNRSVGEELSAEETKKVWAAVAWWLHREKSTGTCHRQELQERLVEVLTGYGRDELEAEAIAESYLTAATERAGLLEERGANVFAFMHQTFQEYLAARHLRLAKPRGKAIERILAVAPDPRWREVVRLAAGFIGVIQEDDEMATELVVALAEDDRDPLEPYLCGSLRLAASCLADDVRVAPRERDEIVARICDRITALEPWPVAEGLVEEFAAMRVLVPGREGVRALCRLLDHSRREVRMEAARLLARAVHRSTDAVSRLRSTMENDSDENVKAHAAVGLWHAGERGETILRWLQHGVGNPLFKMKLTPDAELIDAFVQLLQLKNTGVQIEAARILGEWGHQDDATSALLQLLQHHYQDVQMEAARILGEWGHQDDATPALIQLLQHDHPGVQIEAAKILGQWGHQDDAIPPLIQRLQHDNGAVRGRSYWILEELGHQDDATPALIRLLQHDNARVQIDAASFLGRWGPQDDATPALIQLLQHDNASVQIEAAKTLGRWGPKDDAIPSLIQRLQQDNAYFQEKAASALGRMGPHDDATPALIQLLQHDNASGQIEAARTLGRWGHQDDATPALIQLLQHDKKHVQIQAARTLGQWGPQDDATPALIQLLQHDDADVQIQAARTLEQYAGAGGSAVALLPRLIPDPEPAIAYLESAGGRDARPPEPETARLLAQAIEPVEGDPPHVKALRNIVHIWAWRASQRAD